MADPDIQMGGGGGGKGVHRHPEIRGVPGQFGLKIGVADPPLQMT